MATFSMTYDVITEESAAQGDVAESGFHIERISIGRKADQMGLRTAIRLARNEYCNEPDSSPADFSRGSMSFYGFSEQSYRTGDELSYTVHFDGLTPSTLKRVARALKAR